MKISEIFYSIQGEGSSLGVPTIFIRTAGCNLKCNFCDSKYASQSEGEDFSVNNVFGVISSLTAQSAANCKKICITGGEPLSQREDLSYLVQNLLILGYTVEIETNGSLHPLVSLDLTSKIHWNISPKLSNSGNNLSESINKGCLLFYNSLDHIFKFVIGTDSDFQEAHSLIQELNLKKIYMMPQGQKDAELKTISLWLIEKCKEFNYCFSPRLHVWLWEGKRGV